MSDYTLPLAMNPKPAPPGLDQSSPWACPTTLPSPSLSPCRAQALPLCTRPVLTPGWPYNLVFTPGPTPVHPTSPHPGLALQPCLHPRPYPCAPDQSSPRVGPASPLDVLHLDRQQVHGYAQHAVVGVAREELDAVPTHIVHEVMELAGAANLTAEGGKGRAKM